MYHHPTSRGYQLHASEMCVGIDIMGCNWDRAEGQRVSAQTLNCAFWQLSALRAMLLCVGVGGEPELIM